MRRTLVLAGWRTQARVAAMVASTTPDAAPGWAVLSVLQALESVVRSWSHRSKRARLLPDALERMATALRSGSSLLQALGDAATSCPAPLGVELQRLAREADTGRAMRDVLDDWVRRHSDTGTRLTACALAVAARAGATPARALDGVAATLRDRLDLADERRALSTQARVSALIMSALPTCAVVGMLLTQAKPVGFLFGTPAGWACLVLGVAFNVAGSLCIWRMTRGAR